MYIKHAHICCIIMHVYICRHKNIFAEAFLHYVWKYGHTHVKVWTNLYGGIPKSLWETCPHLHGGMLHLDEDMATSALNIPSSA